MIVVSRCYKNINRNTITTTSQKLNKKKLKLKYRKSIGPKYMLSQNVSTAILVLQWTPYGKDGKKLLKEYLEKRSLERNGGNCGDGDSSPR